MFPSIIEMYCYGQFDTELTQNYNRFIWLFGMYLMGCYIRLHGIPFLHNLKRRILFLLINVLNLGLYVPMAYYGYAIGHTSPVEFWHPNSIMEVMLSVSLFLVFEKIELEYNCVINYVAKCMLGVYMLHDGELCYFMWNDIFRNSNYQFTRIYGLHMLFAVITVIVVGVAVDSIRKVLFDAVGILWKKEKNIICL